MRCMRFKVKRLQKLVALVYHNVPFYRNKMQEMDLSPMISVALMIS